MDNLGIICIAIIMLPLFAGLMVGLLNKRLSEKMAAMLTIVSVGLAFFLSSYVFFQFINQDLSPFNVPLYNWGKTQKILIQLGLWIDRLTLLMMVVVSFVSWMVHIYTVGYMKGDPGYQRFFSYISLFTFGMLMLVMSNNFLQLFFGWEAVGLMSYLLIGFWFQKESANRASLKAFLVNRLGDMGFLIGIAGVYYYFNSLNYETVFQNVETIVAANKSLTFMTFDVMPITLITICLFIGAMGKSAQMPLHVWLPDSMEGPTPISALIHAATMVTAGLFMIARMSPLFEYSDTALNVVLTIGALTALLTGILGIVQNDIKRIIAYSTLSQLGYMMTAMGASSYAIGIFHLMTHAFFKALLFLGAGSVIIALHHEQNIWKMGNLKKVMPITYWTMLIGSLALIGFPGFSGFYSKDLIIEAVQASELASSPFAYIAILSAVFITAVYTFRLLFVVFHATSRTEHSEERRSLSENRSDHTGHGDHRDHRDHGDDREHKTSSHCHESPKVITIPLILLAIPSVIIGALFVPLLFEGFFEDAIMTHAAHPSMKILTEEFKNVWSMTWHGFFSLPFWLAMVGVATAWVLYILKPELPAHIRSRFKVIYFILKQKYGFDAFNEWILAKGIRALGWICWHLGDQWLIDGLGVNGAAKTVARSSNVVSRLQTGYLYHYAFMMITGLLILLVFLIVY